MSRSARPRRTFPASRRPRPQSPELAWLAIRDAIGRLDPKLADALIEEAPEFAMTSAPSSAQATARLAMVAMTVRTARATERHARRVFEEGMAESARQMPMPSGEEDAVRDADQRALADVQILTGELQRMLRAAPNDP